MNGFLLRFARAVVSRVTSQLTQQFNIVEEQALSPMRSMIQEVTNGVWVGEGANAFVDEVSSIFIPGVGQVNDDITLMRDNIERAIDVMDQADALVRTKSNALADVFGAIY